MCRMFGALHFRMAGDRGRRRSSSAAGTAHGRFIACPGLPCVGQIDRYLGVFDASRGTGVLALRPDRPVAA
ncbi:MAG: hypothetical protein QOE41_4335 [Mycobacterium sp.]|nr:hypothetical protein [Mycobacterium sp.]